MNTNYCQQNCTNMQSMTVSHDVQVIQDYQIPQTSPVSQPQDYACMIEYSFFYKVYNDFQIYNITCKEISFETISSLLSNHDCLTQTQNHVQQSNLHVFYYQQPVDKKIYQVTCEIVSYNYIIRMLNKIFYGIGQNFINVQENLDFSKEHRDNLEFHLKHDLNNYLAPIDTFQQNMTNNNNIINQSLDYAQGHTNINI
jgi:hypothetical protein